MLKLAVNGAAGRMGRRIIALIAQEPQCTLVCALERADHPELGKDAGIAAGVSPLDVAIGTEIAGAPQVLLDFSSPDAALARARECARLGVAVVLGSTGLSQAQLEEIELNVAREVPVLTAANMSLGINLLLRLVAEVAAALGTSYDVEIIECHHRLKKDAPSGTALKLAESVCQAMSWDPEQALLYGREGMVGERPRQQVAVHAVRGGDVVGDHTVVFAGEGERIELVHRASNRDVFARGALRAARFLPGRAPGLYGMADVLFSART